jgi:hypothetical protein
VLKDRPAGASREETASPELFDLWCANETQRLVNAVIGGPSTVRHRLTPLVVGNRQYDARHVSDSTQARHEARTVVCARVSIRSGEEWDTPNRLSREIACEIWTPCPRRVYMPTQKREALSATSEGRGAPSAVGQGSSLPTILGPRTGSRRSSRTERRRGRRDGVTRQAKGRFIPRVLYERGKNIGASRSNQAYDRINRAR